MPDIIIWPELLAPETCGPPKLVPFTRSAGPSLGGVTRVTRTDAGWWRIDYKGVALDLVQAKRAWNAIAADLCGMSGLVSVPIWPGDVAPWASGIPEPAILTTHSDGTTHSDDTPYSQGAISVVAASSENIGSTLLTMQVLNGDRDLSGVHFSHLTGPASAFYVTGRVHSGGGSTYRMRVWPPLRAPIAAGDSLEFDLPRCLCRLATDNAMDAEVDCAGNGSADVSFTEATDYWSDLAAGLI